MTGQVAQFVPEYSLVVYELQKAVDLPSREVIYLNTTNSVMLQISLGLGYSIVPTSLTKAKSSDEKITYIPLAGLSAKSEIAMLYKKNNPSKIVASLVEIVRNLKGKS